MTLKQAQRLYTTRSPNSYDECRLPDRDTPFPNRV
jgi:hypothetical protein